MSTTLVFEEINGISGSNSASNLTVLTNLNFGAADVPNLNTLTYPIAANTNSFAKYIIGLFSGDFTSISNVKFWLASGSLVVGESILFNGSKEYATPSNINTGDSTIPVLWPFLANVAIPWWKYPGSSAYAGGSTTGVINGSGATSGSTQIMRLQLQTTAATPGIALNTKTFAVTCDVM